MTVIGTANQRHIDVVPGVGAIDDHGIELAVAGRAADHAGQIDGDQPDIGPGQIVDGRLVCAAQGIELDGLDIVEVHRDVAEVAEEQRPPAVGCDVEVLVAVAAVEEHGVGPGLALDHVAAVARIPLEYVVAGAEKGDVVALVAVDEVIAVAAEQHVLAVAAEDRVVAGAAVDGELDERGQIAGGGDPVVAAVGVQHEILARADIDGEGRRVQAVEAHALAIGGDREHLRAAAAIDLDGVGAGAAFEQVGVVAGVPDHAVVAAFTEQLVVGVAAGQRIVAAAAEQKIEAATRRAGRRCHPVRRSDRRPNRR